MIHLIGLTALDGRRLLPGRLRPLLRLPGRLRLRLLPGLRPLR